MANSDRLFDSSLLRRQLAQQASGSILTLQYLPTCASTNRECQQLGRHGSVFISDQQTQGRGRRGRDWYSPGKRNLYCSIGVEKQLPASCLGLVPLLVGVSLVEMLVDMGYQDAGLKWPNDLLCDGLKLGGILIETQPRHAECFFLTIGIGLNLVLDEDELAQIGQPATSLFTELPPQGDITVLVAQLIVAVFSAVDDFKPVAIDRVLQRFAKLDALVGQEVRVLSAGDSYQGLYAGIAQDGRVMVDTADGIQSFAAADISLRGADNAAD